MAYQKIVHLNEYLSAHTDNLLKILQIHEFFQFGIAVTDGATL